MAEQRFGLKQRLYAIVVAGLGGSAAAAISFAMAVYDAAHPDPVPTVTVNERVDTGRWFVTVRRAYTGDIPPTGTKPFEPKRYLMVELELNNRSAETSNAFQKLITLAEPVVDGLPGPTYYLARDNWIASSIHPNMPERLIAAWEWPQHAPLPKKIRLRVAAQVYKPRDNLYGAPGWFDRDAAAVVALSVSQREAEH